ncbi:NUDIX domain-containing protein [Geminicoccus flavidas]|uniref:NUDIX domain-containing protein n=1 Tax=Geminicoccus flavidas TaxID=2506407 RepID=UPI001358A582|nr:NUDIX hydrolase [Geminicoccus flavidas]
MARARRLANLLRRLVYRAGFPLARSWWWLTRPSATGVAVAIVAQGRVLVVHQSFRKGLGLVGGGLRPGEDPRAGMVRELAEEVGLVLSPDRLRVLPVLELVHEWRSLRVHLFEAELPEQPALRPDGAEVVAVSWHWPAELRAEPGLHPVLRGWLDSRAEPEPATCGGAGR